MFRYIIRSVFKGVCWRRGFIFIILTLLILDLPSCESDPYCKVRLIMEMPGVEYSVGEIVLVDLVLVNGSSDALEFINWRDDSASTLSVFLGKRLIWDWRTKMIRSGYFFFETQFELEPHAIKRLAKIAWDQTDFLGDKVGPRSYLLRGEFRTTVPGTDYTEKRWITIVPSQ